MSEQRVVVLSGGGGGAKLVEGMARVAGDLTVVANTADDAVIYGLAISPDLDTVMYTLADRINRTTGWGVAGETFVTLGAMAALGEETWFQLGDRDLATHILRTHRLRTGSTLSQVTAEFCDALGIEARVLPMSDDPVASRIHTPDGVLDFQEYFVGRQHTDDVLGIDFDGADRASPAPGVLEALRAAEVIVLGPSNPYVSIGPILAVPGVREAMADSPARVVSVSPIVGGHALKGPAATMLAAMGKEVSALGVAHVYGDLIDVMVIDEQDAHLAPALEDLGLQVVITSTVMGSPADSRQLADTILASRR